MIFAFAREQPRKQSMQKPRREQALFFWAWNRKRFPNFQELWCGSCFWVGYPVVARELLFAVFVKACLLFSFCP